MTTIFDPFTLGEQDLRNRLAMAPMTRNRATLDGTPTELMKEYYRQRNGFGLVITEGVQPSDEGQGYPATPGIYLPEHVAAWAEIADAVHAGGSRLFMQIMHAGRIAHPANTRSGTAPVAPSAVPMTETLMFTAAGQQEIPVAREMTPTEIGRTIDDFRHAAKTAIEAGADGIELHGANGYLIQQFLSPNTNRRIDEYGGNIDKRVRFAVEVATATADAIGAGRVGIRVTPGGTVGEIDEGDDYPELYLRLAEALVPLELAYLHVAFMRPTTERDEQLLTTLRTTWPGAMIINRAGRAPHEIGSDIASGLADIESVARTALANPDLPHRLRHGLPLNEARPEHFYGGGAEGYTDYPTHA